MSRVWLLLLLSVGLPARQKIPAESPRHIKEVKTEKKGLDLLVLYQQGGHHILFSQRATGWLNKLAADSNLNITYIRNTDRLDDNFLEHFRLFIQLDYPPYGWSEKAAGAFRRYIEKGKGGWIGLHHASLVGSFDGYPVWDWYRDFMGGIGWKDYIAGFADARVVVDDTAFPCMRNIPKSFVIEKEEWYTYDRIPGPEIQVIAQVDENSYNPVSSIRMGYHPVIWTNKRVAARNVYIFMGHSPALFDNPIYVSLLRNAISWAAAKDSIQPVGSASR